MDQANYGSGPPGLVPLPQGPKTPMYQFQGNSSTVHQRPGPPRDFSFRPSRMSDRFQRMRGVTPEPLGPSEAAAEQSTKFRQLDNLTDSDEADMDVSESEGGEPRRKKARTLDVSDSIVDGLPKWSNPDPYSVLPPSDDASRKRTDVVKLIRKARVSATQTSQSLNAVSANHDFISFGLDEPRRADSDGYDVPDGAPTGPRANRAAESDPSLGSRKRTHYDDIKSSTRDLPTYPLPARRSGKSFNADGSIVQQWRYVDVGTSSPWYDSAGDGDTGFPAVALHKEVLDFYHWAKPQPFENQIRTELVSRIQRAFSGSYPGSRLKAFGSFAAGLYLPIADMDLVLLSPRFVQSKLKTLGRSKSDIHKCAAIIKRSGEAMENSVQAIASAKVPIVKFIDRETGLRVDLSFDNDSGIIANDTFREWKSEHPAMPIIVSIVKQFLLLRGLNDVSTGGLGGFSIICLVTSLLQHLPPTGGIPNLGTLLMEFFNFYGNQFDQSTLGIKLNPPSYFNKSMEGNFPYNINKAHRLCIVDPNRPENDISGGTAEIELILRTFKRAYTTLQDRVNQLARGRKFENGLLGCILAGDYRSYGQQRALLQQIYRRSTGFVAVNSRRPDRVLPPPPPPSTRPPPQEQPPPPPPPQSVTARNVKTRSQMTSGKLAEETMKDIPGKSGAALKKLCRKYQTEQTGSDVNHLRSLMLKDLRPDLNNIPDSLTGPEVKRFAGYSDHTKMAQDLWNRAHARGLVDSVFSMRGAAAGASGPRTSYTPPSVTGQKTVEQVKAEAQGASKNQVRASMLREMRPDLQNLPARLKADDAAKLGGYRDTVEMNHDFQRISKERLRAARSAALTNGQS